MTEMSLAEKMVVNSKLQYLYHKKFGVNRLIGFANADPVETILEIGCGIGLTTNFIASRFATAKITALDYDSDQLKIAYKSRRSNAISFVKGDATQLQFEDQSFDLIFQIFAFHHIPDYKSAMKEVYRTLKPNGRFLCLEIPVKSVNILNKWITFQPAEFTKKEFVGNLEKSGFCINRCEGRSAFFLEATKG